MLRLDVYLLCVEQSGSNYPLLVFILNLGQISISSGIQENYIYYTIYNVYLIIQLIIAMYWKL